MVCVSVVFRSGMLCYVGRKETVFQNFVFICRYASLRFHYFALKSCVCMYTRQNASTSWYRSVSNKHSYAHIPLTTTLSALSWRAWPPKAAPSYKR